MYLVVNRNGVMEKSEYVAAYELANCMYASLVWYDGFSWWIVDFTPKIEKV